MREGHTGRYSYIDAVELAGLVAREFGFIPSETEWNRGGRLPHWHTIRTILGLERMHEVMLATLRETTAQQERHV